MTFLVGDRVEGNLSLSPQSSDFASICQRQIEQIDYCLPCVGVRIVYRVQAGDERQTTRFYQKKSDYFNRDIAVYLEEESWLDRDFPELQWTQWQMRENILSPLSSLGSSKPAQNTTFVYIYCFDGRDRPDEYFLFWSETKLAESQQHYLHQQVSLLQDYLTLMQAVTKQQKELDFLEQTIQRGKHQFREPLALIGLYAENLCLQLSEGKCQEQAQGIRDTVKELSYRLKQLLNGDRDPRISAALYDIRKILQETLLILQPRLEQKNVQIIYPDRGIILAVDRWQIKQVFEVLLCNALHFSPEGETVSCNWEILPHEVLIEVCDRGKGLSPEDSDRIFDPFYSKRVGGTGLGLAIAKDIISQHRGKIWGENRGTGGAKFSFTLPREVAESAIGVLGEFHL